MIREVIGKPTHEYGSDIMFTRPTTTRYFDCFQVNFENGGMIEYRDGDGTPTLTVDLGVDARNLLTPRMASGDDTSIVRFGAGIRVRLAEPCRTRADVFAQAQRALLATIPEDIRDELIWGPGGREDYERKFCAERGLIYPGDFEAPGSPEPEEPAMVEAAG